MAVSLSLARRTIKMLIVIMYVIQCKKAIQLQTNRDQWRRHEFSLVTRLPSVAQGPNLGEEGQAVC